MTNSIDDIHLADVLLVTGSNTTEAHPVISLEMKKAVRKRGAKLILIDPREIELANFATLHLRPRSGTDVALLNTMAHVIIEEGLVDEDFIASRTENFDALKNCSDGLHGTVGRGYYRSPGEIDRRSSSDLRPGGKRGNLLGDGHHAILTRRG